MKVTVINEKESVIYNGEIYGYKESFEIDEKIGQSLIERGYIAIATEGGEGESDDLQEASYTELKKMAASMGLPANGRREELIARIQEAQENPEVDGEAEEVEDEAAEEAEETDEIAGDLPNTNMPE